MKNGVGTGVNVTAGASTTTRETTERVTNIVFMHARLSEGLANWQEHDALLCHRRFLHVSAPARHLRHYFLFSPSSGARMSSAPFFAQAYLEAIEDKETTLLALRISLP
jgi:hypothetical protein